MQYSISGGTFPVVICNLVAGETMDCQKGAMAWMSPNMEMQTSTGGIGKIFGKLATGESIFQNHYTSLNTEGQIAFASTCPGAILAIPISSDRSVVAQKRAYLASQPGVSFEVFFQKKGMAGLFAGEGFIMQKFIGQGMVFLEIDGSVVEYNLAPGQTMVIDTSYLAAMDSTCSIDIQSVKGIGNALVGGEGLFNTKVTGPGKIWLQTMPLVQLAGSIRPFIPSN